MSKRILSIGGIEARPGEHSWGTLDVCQMADGSVLRLPVHIIAGKETGPTLGVIGLQHGNEVASLAVMRQLVEHVDPRELCGNLALIPVANPIAFESGHRNSWIDSLNGDGGNLNRVWPGRDDGFITSRLAYVISQRFLPHLDCAIDFHGTVTASISLYYAFIVSAEGALADRCRALSLSFGMEIIMRRGVKPTSFSDYVIREFGIPVVACEMGDFWGLGPDRARRPAEELVRRMPEVGFTGVTNVMKHLQMLPGQPRLPQRQVIVSPETNVRSCQGGILFPRVGVEDLGKLMPQGTLLGEVVSPRSLEVVEEIRAPYSENILIAAKAQRPCSRLNSGEYAFLVADWGTAEWVEN